MTTKEWAERLNGRQMGEELAKSEELEAQEDNVVILFGESDDIVKIRGAIREDIDCYGGALISFDHARLSAKKDSADRMPEGKKRATARAFWCRLDKDVSWSFETEIPHETFRIMEEGEPFCDGIVFKFSDIAWKIKLFDFLQSCSKEQLARFIVRLSGVGGKSEDDYTQYMDAMLDMTLQETTALLEKRKAK